MSPPGPKANPGPGKLLLFGSRIQELDPGAGLDWTRLVQRGSDRFRLVQLGSDWTRLVQTGSDQFRLVQTRPDRFRLDQTGLSWFSSLKAQMYQQDKGLHVGETNEDSEAPWVVHGDGPANVKTGPRQSVHQHQSVCRSLWTGSC